MSAQKKNPEEQNTPAVYTLPYTLELSVPIQVTKDVIVTEIVFNKPPIAEDFASVNPTNMVLGDMLNIMSKMTGQPRKTVIGHMCAKDMFAAMEVLNSFLPSSQETGETA